MGYFSYWVYDFRNFKNVSNFCFIIVVNVYGCYFMLWWFYVLWIEIGLIVGSLEIEIFGDVLNFE